MRVGIIFIGLILIGGIAAAYFLELFPGQSPVKGENRPATSVPLTTSPGISPSPPAKSSVPPGTTSAPAVPASPPPAQPPAGITFELNITDVSGSGLNRDVTAEISNKGTRDAHNAWAKVEVLSQGTRVKVNGQDNIRVDIGLLKAGQTTIKQVSLSFGFFDGLKLTQNGATIVLTVICDEGTQNFNYDYQP